MKRIIQSMKSILTVVAIWAMALPAAAQVQPVDGSGFKTTVNVTDHSEEALTWCGAATGQMLVSGYPGGACVQTQADMWNAIQSAKVEPNWDTDPAGLRSAMTTLCPLPPGHIWYPFNDANKYYVMYTVARMMKLWNYPVAVLHDTNPHHNALATHLEHWVTIKEIVTDRDPTTNTMVTLQSVSYVDQMPNLSASVVTIVATGSDWYNGVDGLNGFQAVVKPSSAYNGKFVALIEPPTVTGQATAKQLPISGALLSAERALAAAQNTVRSGLLTGVESFREIAQMQPQAPILVNAARRGYYIVLYAKPGSAPSMAVLINAYSGDFMEAGHFAPHPLIAEKDAIERAVRLVGRGNPRGLKARLVSSEGELPYFPAWRVSVDGEEVVVQHNGAARRAPPEDSVSRQQ